MLNILMFIFYIKNQIYTMFFFLNITNIDSDDDSADITDIDYTNKNTFENQLHDYGPSSISSHSEPSRKLAFFSQSNTYYFYIL